MAALLAQPGMGRAAEGTNASPDFKEVYDLIRAHLAGESETDLNRDAVQGLLNQLHAKISIVASKTAPGASSQALVLSKSALYDGPVAYLRVGRVGPGLAGQISTAYHELDGTNHLKGVVIDLRFADGHDYAEAATAADVFIAKERPLLDWGQGVIQSKAKTNAITLPLAVLINQHTTAAAEALAAVLREDDRAILLGATTAGEAAMSQEFPLQSGQYLRIATAAIKLGNGETLSIQGVKPDIQVAVKPEDERAYYADPFKEVSSPGNLITSILGGMAVGPTNGTNRATRPRPMNEAELMRERKEKPGVDAEDLPPSSMAQDVEVEKPVIRDPVLGRALDLVKGISVIRPTHSP